MPAKVSPEYVPYGTVRPEGPPTVREGIQINYPEVRISDAVGKAMSSYAEHGIGALAGSTGAVAHALDNLGSQLDKTGNQLWERAQGLQELQNQNDLSKRELEFDKYVATKKSQFENNKGEAATEATYKAYIKDLEKQQLKLGEGLPPRTWAQWNKSTGNQIGQAGIHAAKHVATEIRGVTIATSEAKVNQKKDELAKNEDLNRNQGLIDDIDHEIRSTQAPAKGWSKEQTDEAIRKQVGEGYIGQLQTLSKSDPWQAMKILEHPENRGLWDDKQYIATKAHIINEMTRLGARNIGNDIQSKEPDADLQKKLDEGNKKAEEEEKRTGQKLPDLKEATRQALKERHHTHNEIVAEARKKNIQTVEAVLNGNGENANGNKPKNLDELYAYGGQAARDAYNKLEPTDKKRMDRELNRIALGLTDPTYESEIIRMDLEEMRQTDPAQFRDTDLNKIPELRLADKKRFEKEQEKLKTGAAKLEADPREARAWSVAKNAAAIPKDIDPATNKTRYLLFKGVFREGIYAAQKQKGFDKPLTNDEIVEVAHMVKQQMKEPGFWNRMTGGKIDLGDVDVPLYKQLEAVPKGYKDNAKEKYPNMTDEAIISSYRRDRLEAEWEKRHKGTK